MKRVTRIRWLSLAAVLGGVLLVHYDIHRSLIDTGVLGHPSVGIWLDREGLLAAFLLVLGLIGIYAYQADAAGLPGLVVFGMMLLGLLAWFAYLWGRGIVLPEVASQNSDILVPFTDLWLGSWPAAVSQLLFGLGLLLFGVMIWQVDMLPKTPAGLIMLGSLIGFMDASLNLGALHPPFGPMLLAGVGFTWLGIILWRGRP